VTLASGAPSSAGETFQIDKSSAHATRGLVLPAIGLIVGTGLLCLAYSVAATRPPGELEYTLFWLGELAGIVPLAVRLVGVQASRSERLALLTAMGLFAFVPMFLRDPTGPLFYDALIHWRQAQTIFQSGHPFTVNSLLPVIKDYPGLEELTASLRNLTGLSTFDVATAFLWLLHVISLIGIFILTELTTKSSRAAGIAALFYSVNPAFMFFDAQFAYETLAIVFAIWVLACVIGMQTSIASRRQRTMWFVISSVLGASCIVTHHITTYALIVALLAVSIASLALRNQDVDARRRARLTWTFTAMLASGAAAWVIFVAPGTVAYLAPHIAPDIGDLFKVLARKSTAPLYFTSNKGPTYEQIAEIATVVLLVPLAIAAWVTMKRRAKRSPGLLGLGIFALLYFVSVPIMLTSQGEAAIRSWGDTYIGLAVLIAALGAFALPRFDSTKAGRIGAAVVASTVLMVLLVGNVHVQAPPAYRFPGPYIYGSDTRSLTPELSATARWLRATVGPNEPTIADRDTGTAIGAIGGEPVASASSGFPIWDLYFSTKLPTERLLRELRTSGYHYLVIESEMYQSLPLTQFYFNTEEPGYGTRTQPPPKAALAKFSNLPWVTEIYSTEHLRIYRLDYSQVNACPADPRLPIALLPGCRTKT
jgi:hypothetical protein